MVSVVVCAVESRLTQAVSLRQVLADAGHEAVVHFDTGEGPTLAHAYAWQAAAATAREALARTQGELDAVRAAGMMTPSHQSPQPEPARRV